MKRKGLNVVGKILLSTMIPRQRKCKRSKRESGLDLMRRRSIR